MDSSKNFKRRYSPWVNFGTGPFEIFYILVSLGGELNLIISLQPAGVLDDFDEAYETSEFEEDDRASITGGDKAKAKLATADDETVRRLENCFKKLTWARSSSSLLKRFLTKKGRRFI